MDSLFPFMIIASLIVLNALFVAAEFAIVGAPRATIDRLAAQGNVAAQRVKHILHDPRRQDRYIATAQLGITFASLGLGMYGEHVLADCIVPHLEVLGASKWITAHAAASVLAVTILTYFHIVVGEMVPKSISLQYAERTCLWITPIMLGIKTALLPLVVLLNGIGNGMLKLLRVDRQMTAGHYHTSEDLRYIIEESAESGLLQAKAGQVLRDLFEFGELDAAKVMVPRVHISGIPLDADLKRVKEIVRETRHTQYPVYDHDLDHIVGGVHVKDILRLLIDERTQIKDLLHPVEFIPETSELDVVLATIRKEQTQMVVVMDEHGGTSGLITIKDLFEEVVGPVEEDLSQTPAIYHDEDGKLYVAGTVRIDEVGDQIGISLEHEEIDTVSGLILSELERPPKIGDIVNYQGVGFEVIGVEGHGVSECLVTYDHSDDEEPDEDES